METSKEEIKPENRQAGRRFFVEDEFFDRYASLCGWKGYVVYTALCRYANKKRSCFPSVEQLSRKLGIAENSVKRGISELRKWSIIKVEKAKRENGTWKNNCYCLLDSSKWKKIPETAEGLGKNCHSPPLTHYNHSSVVTHQNTEENLNHSSPVTNPQSSQRLDHSPVVINPEPPQRVQSNNFGDIPIFLLS